MIKPSSYWAMHKTCDPYTLGRVAASLGGQIVDPPLNPAEKALVSVVEQDSELMDERIEEQRERWKERQRKSRLSRNVTGDNGDNGDNEVSHEKGQCHVTSIHPSIHPTLDNTDVLSASTCDTRTRGDIPELKDVVSAATSTMGVPEWYARWWYEQMVAYDWKSTKGVRIDHRNWRAMLKAWHNRSLGDPKEYERVRSEYDAKKPKAVKVTADDWALCAERCSAFQGGRCKNGKVVPPQMRPRQIPPEECDGFACIETEKRKEQ